MPLAPRYTWEQDASSFALTVVLPGGALKSADIYVSDLVLKINSSPYVLLLDLFALVDDASAVAKAIASESLLRITLQKQDAQLWPVLVCKDTKAALQARRLESMARKSASDVALAEQRRDRKHRDEKQTLRAQMAVDDAARQLLTDRKADEKQREEQSLYESFRALQEAQQQQQQQQESAGSECNAPLETLAAATPVAPTSSSAKLKKKSVTFATDAPINERKAELPVLELGDDGSFDLPAPPPPAAPSVTTKPEVRMTKPIDDSNGADDSVAPSKVDGHARKHSPPTYIKKQETMSAAAPAPPPPTAKQTPNIAAAKRVVPPPRTPLQSELSFTPRVFPTPSRESKAAEEDDWLLKNRKHLARHRGLRGSASYDISESDPMWLKAKGDDFCRARDFESAVSAYTEALALAPERSDLATTCLANRAATHLQLRDFEAHCSTALSFIPDTADASSNDDDSSSMRTHYRLKLKLCVRRGTAYCRVGQFTEAKADYGVALAMDPQHAALQDDFVQLVAVEKAVALQRAGDASFRAQDLAAAVTHYSDALRLDPRSIACLSNRAACHLLLHALDACVADCSQALTLLQQNGDSDTDAASGATGLAFFAVGPAPGSAKRRAWVLKTLVRRGTALAAMRDWERAEADYAASVELDPSSVSLQADLAHVRAEKAKAARITSIDCVVSTAAASGTTRTCSSTSVTAAAHDDRTASAC